MSSSGRSKAPRGGKEDHIDDRTSGAVEEPIGKNSEFLSRREFIERMDYESAKNEDRCQKIEDRISRVEICVDDMYARIDRKIDKMMELVRTLLVKSSGSKKDSPLVLEGTQSPVVLGVKVPDGGKLLVHLDEDYLIVKPEEEKKEEKPVVVATVHFSAACTVPKQIVVESVEKLELEPIELIVQPRIQSLSEDTLNIKLCDVLDSIAVLFQAWPEFSFSDGFPPGPPKKPPPWFETFTTSICFWVNYDLSVLCDIYFMYVTNILFGVFGCSVMHSASICHTLNWVFS